MATTTEYMRKWRAKNSAHYREYQKTYKRKMRAKAKSEET